MLNAIRVWPRRQWRRYSCTAATFQMCAATYTGEYWSHREAIEMLDCKPHGSTTTEVVRALRSRGMTVPPCVRRRERVSYHLSRGRMLVIDDFKSWRHAHMLALIGETAGKYIVIDPMWGLPTLRDKDYVLDAAEAMHAIGSKKRTFKSRRIAA